MNANISIRASLLDRHASATSIQKPQIRGAIWRIVRLVTSDPNLYDDLFQEGVLYYWRSEANFPGQTTSWYLHRCRLELRALLRSGRCVDAFKRRHLRIEPDCETQPRKPTDHLVQPENVRSLVSARDILEQLSMRLGKLERQTLALVALEFYPTEIAQSLRVSRPAIAKRLRKIQAAATSLGIAA